MKKINKILLGLFVLTSFKQFIFSAEVIEYNPAVFKNIIPAHLINNMGFSLPEKERVSTKLLGNPNIIIPMYPFFKPTMFGQEFVGVKVPASYGLASDKNYSAMVKTFNSLNIEDGVYLVPYVYGNYIYGIRSDYSIVIGNTSSVGFGFSFGGGGKSLQLGNVSSYGVEFKFGSSPAVLGRETGFNLNPVQSFFDNLNMIFNKQQTESIMNTALKFTPYIQSYMLSQFKRLEGLGSDELHKAVYSSDLENIKTNKKHLNIKQDIFTDEFFSLKRDLHSNIEKEAEWKDKVKEATDGTLIYKNVKANQLVQNLCDHVSSSYKMPYQIWPKCRIAATPSPNAWAYPGGDIFISAGLIGVLSDMDSLLYIIAHEVGHVYARHTSHSAVFHQSFIYGVNVAGIAHSIYSATAGAQSLGVGTGFFNWFWGVTASSFITSYPVHYAIKVAAAGFMFYKRSNELQSDRLGHQVSLSVGANPLAIGKGWKEFSDFFKKYIPVEKTFWDKLLASHPDSDTRQEKIEQRSLKYKKFSKVYIHNKLDNNIYNEYKALHASLIKLVKSYGEDTRKKIFQAKKKKLKLEDQFLLQSMFSQASQCVFHVFDMFNR